MTIPQTLTERLQAGPATAAELMQVWPVSQPTLSRALQSLQSEGAVIKLGTTRGVRYAAPRTVAGAGSRWPIFRVDQAGSIHELGSLQSLQPGHYNCDATPVALHGLSDGLPYFLQDQRPAGFLGRAVPQNVPELGLPARVVDWCDDHYLLWLTHRGADCVSDLIVGARAVERYLQSLKSRQVLVAADRFMVYPQLAESAMTRGQPGSSAHGEHPKFTASVDHGGGQVQVIVKFSPHVNTSIGQRWADLLVAEHLAHVHLNAQGITAANSTVLLIDGRMFLEVERFDRVGPEGRKGVVSLLAVDAARFGQLDTWSRAAIRLTSHGVVTKQDAQQIRLLEAFAMLIANTDRHFGNLALFDCYDGRFSLAPVYDMLPMLFAPQHDQLVVRAFEAPDPTAETLVVWSRAVELAQGYWERLVSEARLSEPFRGVCASALAALRAVPQRAAPAIPVT